MGGDDAVSGSMWIAKPAVGTRGVGIRVFNNLRLMELFLQEQQAAGVDYVVQKYIERPLLIHGRKFDIRIFVLVVSLDPLVVFLNTDCYVRFASVPYDAAAVADGLVHLTNHQVQ